MTDFVKALSIRQPWAWLIVNGFKDVENRTWPHAPTFRGHFLIHASRKIDADMHQLLTSYVLGHQMASMTGFMNLPEPQLQRLAKEYPTGAGLLTGGIVGEAELIDVVTESDSPWFQKDHLGFVLRDAKKLPFSPLKGQLGFFDVPVMEDGQA